MLHSVACQGVSRTKASGGMSEYLDSGIAVRDRLEAYPKNRLS
jgi:hypothetical protein